MLRPMDSAQPAAGTVPASPIGLGASPRVPLRALLAIAVVVLAAGLLLARLLAPAPASAPAAAASGSSRLPLSAWQPISAALGEAQPAYLVTSTRAGLTASNPAQGLAEHFDRTGVAIASRSIHEQLGLSAVGYGTSLATVPAVAPTARGDRVSYARAGLQEWYANGPLGLEQGFTLLRAPAGAASGPLTLAIGLSGDAHAALARDAQTLTLTRGGAPTIAYTGLRVSDARGRALHAWLALDGSRLLVRVDARGAAYPLRIDPFFQQGEKFTGTSPIGMARFGFSVALSSEANTALISGIADHEGAGAVWVFTRTGETWTQQAKLTATGEEGAAALGTSVALSADGNTALLGAPKNKSGLGAAFVFTRSGEAWTQQAKIVAAEEVGNGSFGIKVALSGDGNTALITGQTDNSGVGAGWVFTRSGEAWTQQTKLTATEEIGAAKTGYGAALSADGNTAILGGYADHTNVGAAWVFTRSGEAWAQQTKLLAEGEVGAAEFGESVAISGEGTTALIGGEGDSEHAGAAWVFTRSGEAWAQQAKLTATGQIGRAQFGNHSVALSTNGNTAFVSGWGDKTDNGAVWVFTRAEGAWSQLQKLTGGGEAGSGEFGVGLALAGNTALIGAPNDDNNVGAVWDFAHNNSPIAITGNASSLTPTSATLNATVDPDGETVSDCHFEYGTTTAYGTSVPCASLPGSGEAPVPVSAPLSGLIERTTYHFRIVATNPTATSFGADNTFTTPKTPPNPPEFGRCVKLAKGVKGSFATASCTTAATSLQFSYEWESGVGAKKHFTIKIKAPAPAELETVTKSKIVCTGQTGAGEYTGSKTVGNVTLVFTGCTLGATKCSTAGAAEGELRSAALDGTLGVITTSKEGPVKNTIGLDLVPVLESGPVVEFTCGTTTATVSGSVIATVLRDAMKTVTNVTFVQAGGKQKPESFEGQPKDVLEAKFGEAAAEQIGLKLVTVQTNEEAIEINSVA